MNTMLSVAILLLIVLVAAGLVLTIGNPIIDMTLRTADIKDAEDDMHVIDNYIRTVAREGKDAVRVFKFSSPKSFESMPGEDAIQFSAESIQLFDYLTRSFSGNFVYVSGANVQCQEKDGNGDGVTDLVAENDKIKAVFKKVSSGAIYTDSILQQIIEKTNNVNISVGNSSVVINEDASTSSGEGYTEISQSGVNLPLCQVHAFINTTLDYDVYYKLYSGADFLAVEVRNIR